MQALALAADELKRVSSHDLAGHLYEIYQVRAGVYQRMGQQDAHLGEDLTKEVANLSRIALIVDGVFRHGAGPLRSAPRKVASRATGRAATCGSSVVRRA